MKKRRWLLVGIAFVLLLGAGVSAALFMSHRRDVTTSSEEAYQAYKDAVANENRFYFKEARLSFAKAVELDPSFAMALLGLARQSKDDDQRLALLRRAAKEKDRLTERERLHVEMQLAFNEKRRDDGLKIASEIHQKYPTDTRSAQVLASQEFALGNTDRGIKIFEELLSVDPNNAEAYNQMGYFYGYRGDYEKAVEAFKRYQFIAADTANPFDSLGEVQAYSGHYPEALENLNRALAIKPDFVESIAHIAVAYEGMGDYRKAIAQYEKAAETTDNTNARRGYLGRAVRAAYYLGDRAEMLRLATQAKSIKPEGSYADYAAANTEAAMALIEGRPAEARRILTDLEPKLQAKIAKENLPPGYKVYFPDINLVMALAYESEGKSEEALEWWKKNAFPPRQFEGFEERRSIYEARAKVAVALARKGDLDGAEKLIAENRKWNASWAPTREEESTVAELRREKVLAAAK
jgi:tetratricopeptide (TPR) repeat protein